jgi:hypothetical protein
MYEKEKEKDLEQIPLYIEDVIYVPMNEISKEKENIIIIDLF